MPFFVKDNTISMGEYFYKRYALPFKNLIFEEIPLEDFRERHLFTAKLRILLFLLTWSLFFIFIPEIWSQIPLVPLIFNFCFFVINYTKV